MTIRVEAPSANRAAFAAMGAALGIYGSAPATGLVFVGDSIFAGGFDGGGVPVRVCYQGGFRMVANLAVAGKTSTQVLSEQIPLAVATTGASHCVIMAGTNDPLNSILSATTCANFVAMFAALRTAGIEPVVCGLLPNDTSVGNAATHAARNEALKRVCTNYRVRFVDNIPSLVSSASGVLAWNATYKYDSVHPNSVGAKVIAGNIIAALGATRTPLILAELDDRTFGADALISSATNNAVSFTDTDVDGVPDEFFSLGSGGTYSVQAPDANGFGKWARCAISGGTTVGFQTTARSLATLGLVAGDRVLAGYRIRIVDVNQALTVTCNFLSVTAASGFDVTTLFNEQSGGAAGDDIYIQHEMVIGGGTNFAYRWTGTGTGYFEVNRPILTKVTALDLI